MAEINFNANEVEPMMDMSPIPNGDYKAIVEETELKTTKDGQGRYLACTFQIISGEFQSRKLWVNLNLVNKNDMAVKIARSELASICLAVGKPEPKDSDELCNIPLMIKVAVVKKRDTRKNSQSEDKYTDELENKIKKYSKHGAQQATQQRPQPQKQWKPEPAPAQTLPTQPPPQQDAVINNSDIPF